MQILSFPLANSSQLHWNSTILAGPLRALAALALNSQKLGDLLVYCGIGWVASLLVTSSWFAISISYENEVSPWITKVCTCFANV